jgi:sporulation protein YlmC with PRC-barrel domain
VLAAFLRRLGVELPDLAARRVLNTRGEQVGEVVTAR